MEYLIGAIYMGVLIMAIVALDDWWHREPQQDIHEMVDLDALYYEIWNGTEADRVPAWYRVIGHIEITDKWELMPEAQKRLRKELDRNISDSYVAKNGDVVLNEEAL